MERTVTKIPKIDLLNRLTEPVMKLKVMPIQVRRYFTDVTGAVVDKATVPLALQTDYPVYMLSEFDRQGAYFIGNKIAAPLDGYQFYATFVWGYNSPLFFGFTGLSTIQNFINNGDIVTVYVDSIIAPSYFIWIVQSCAKTIKSSLASILQNAHSHNPGEKLGMLNVERIQYFTNNVQQWNQAIFSMRTDALGNYKHDAIDPVTYRMVSNQQETFIDMKIRFVLNQYVGLYTYMLFASNSMDFNIHLKH